MQEKQGEKEQEMGSGMPPMARTFTLTEGQGGGTRSDLRLNRATQAV